MNKLPQSQSSSKQRVVLSQDVTGRAAAYHVCLSQLPLPHGLENPSCGLKLLPHIRNVLQVFSVLASSSASCEDGLCFPQLLALWQGLWRSLKKDSFLRHCRCVGLTTDYDHQLDEVILAELFSVYCLNDKDMALVLCEILNFYWSSGTSAACPDEQSSSCRCWRTGLLWILEKYREVLKLWRIILKSMSQAE